MFVLFLCVWESLNIILSISLSLSLSLSLSIHVRWEGVGMSVLLFYGVAFV